MSTVHFDLDASLAALLPPARRNEHITVEFSGPQTAKHLIETLGIPHTEVAQVRLSTETVQLGYLVCDGDSLSVSGFDSEGTPEEPAFVLDGNVGRLATGLRMLGLDCAYPIQASDSGLARIVVEEGRILLTRDRHLLMRKAITRGYLVRSQKPEVQLHEVCHRFGLLPWLRPFRRCIRCNGVLKPALKSAIEDRLLPLTRLYHDEYRSCPDCGQIYWEGSHLSALREKLRRLIAGLS